MSTAIIIIVIIVVVVYFLLGKSSTKQAPSSTRHSQTTIPVSDNLDWLMEMWKKADQEQQEGRLETFPKWFFDEATPRQMEKLASLNVSVGGGKATKGKASDLIGLFYPIDEDDLEVLKFFKVQHKDMNQTNGRYKAKELLNTSENLSQWENRPATQEQKEFYKFFGIKVAAGLSIKDAEKTIKEARAKAGQNEAIKLDEWDAYASIITDLSDKEMLKDDFEIKKPSLALIREAVEALVKEGFSLTDLEAYEVAEKIQELKPDMARAV